MSGYLANIDRPGGRYEAAAGDGFDPALRMVTRWYEARRRYCERRHQVETLRSRVPQWIRDWRGVYAGYRDRDGGRIVSELARDEESVAAYYRRLSEAARGPAQSAVIDNKRRVALAELRLVLAAEKGAYRAAELPFEPGSEDRYWRPYRRRIEDAERAIEATPARSIAGLLAKCRHVADFVRMTGERPDDGGDGWSEHTRRMVAAIVDDMERLRGPGPPAGR